MRRLNVFELREREERGAFFESSFALAKDGWEKNAGAFFNLREVRKNLEGEVDCVSVLRLGATKRRTIDREV